MLFKGSGVALVTPFDENNHVNFNMLNDLIEFHIKNKSDAIIVCGTTGESATLSQDEKREIIKFSVKVANSRIPIIAGTGSNDTKKTIELSKYAENQNVNGLLIVTPYYNKCTQEGLYLHYKAIASQVNIPIILYNVPSRTNVDISVKTISKLSKLKNICGIKEASTDISKIAQIIKSTNDDFLLYSGNDDLLIPILALGGVGVISVAANIIPYQIHDICTNMFEHNLMMAKKIYYEYFDLIKSLFIEVNPIPIKYALKKSLYNNIGTLRLPLTNIQEENANIIDYQLKKLHLI